MEALEDVLDAVKTKLDRTNTTVNNFQTSVNDLQATMNTMQASMTRLENSVQRMTTLIDKTARRRRLTPSNHTCALPAELTNLWQAYKSVDEYYQEMELIMQRADRKSVV